MAIFSNIVSVIFLVFFVSIASSQPHPLIESLSRSIDHFSSDFIKAISMLEDHAGKNLITSPMSAHMVLSMLSLGAKGNTLEELNKGLYLSDTESTKEAYKKEIEMLNGLKKIIMMVANKVYVKEGVKFELAHTFQKDVTEVFDSEVENIDFTQRIFAADKINAWVEKKTKETIRKIIDASDLTDEVALILVNTIYFKGEWKNNFDPYSTTKTEFGIDRTTVEMMYQTDYFNYGENADLDAKILELPLKGDEVTMVILLPNTFNGLAAIEEKMNENYHSFSLNKFELLPEVVDLSLPKFQIKSTIDLTVVLPKLGMGSMFTDKAELGGLLINSTIPLKVGKGIQKAFIDVNENGVTAGAASEVEEVSLTLPTKQFIADHPFLFAFFKDGQEMFSGKFTNKE